MRILALVYFVIPLLTFIAIPSALVLTLNALERWWDNRGRVPLTVDEQMREIWPEPIMPKIVRQIYGVR
jgi:hypothetical protein